MMLPCGMCPVTPNWYQIVTPFATCLLFRSFQLYPSDHSLSHACVVTPPCGMCPVDTKLVPFSQQMRLAAVEHLPVSIYLLPGTRVSDLCCVAPFPRLAPGLNSFVNVNTCPELSDAGRVIASNNCPAAQNAFYKIASHGAIRPP